MFSDNKKNKTMAEATSNQNIIAKGTTIVGDLKSEGDFRIDGTVEGNIKTPGKVVVGKSGSIKGSLEGTDAHFEGAFLGKLTLSGTLTLKSTANIEGDVVVGKLAVEPGASFNVSCAMQGHKKQLKDAGQQKAIG
ncbi:bactofilin family protein [Algibacter lectus]|uniref:Cytoskeletal protein CcmA (Bactofilin family) n=1 Tax=Algibacter lectus TaxID=221126 RepID=A0A4R8MA49_9FLAO|nr:polymer-forming cytoskeletal protein [Algibacter lectus]MDO7137054.1 polymer-forming cytoskeletal protein [Algibacter lectus]MWW24471.1 polymer-forming cytoskeletal protein [Algibacter lectus]TDY62490.1 cytoskeletal protein CcmA (bactofilin family) [Algibacter lectus]SFC62176.1 protein CcmA, bactofilin family [Algibacter lectus]